MVRVHQFNKVEQFAFTRPEESWDEHERLLANTEEIVAELGLPYRVVVLPAGDIVHRVGQDVRRRDLVPEPGPVPRDGVDLQHHRLPGPAPRHALPRRARAGARAHAQRHRRRRPNGARRPGELPGRGARRAPLVRRAGPHRALTRRGDNPGHEPRRDTGDRADLRPCDRARRLRRMARLRATIPRGGVRERPNRAVLKTVEGQPSVGSNPTPAAHHLEPLGV